MWWVLNRLSSRGKGFAILISLGLIWGYSVFRGQIGEDSEWAGLLIAMGTVSIVSFFLHAEGFRSPLPQRSFACLVFLFAFFVAFQLTPLPIGLLRWLSPARLEIHDGLGALAAHSSFVSVSTLPSATMDHAMRILAYALVFFLVTGIADNDRKKLWLLAVPIIAIASLQAVVGLLQVGMGDAGAAARGGYINRNHFAGLLEMSLPFAVMGAVAAAKQVRIDGGWKQAASDRCLPECCNADVDRHSLLSVSHGLCGLSVFPPGDGLGAADGWLFAPAAASSGTGPCALDPARLSLFAFRPIDRKIR